MVAVNLINQLKNISISFMEVLKIKMINNELKLPKLFISGPLVTILTSNFQAN